MRAGVEPTAGDGGAIVQGMSGPPDTRRGDGASNDARRNNPMNRLVPYLDLFGRLGDEELARLAVVDVDLVKTLRKQVVEIGEGLKHYLDLLPRLNDEELVRLSGASIKTIRFWRLCQPPKDPSVPPPRRRSSSLPPPKPEPEREASSETAATPASAPSTPIAAWDTTGPAAGTETVLTPFGQTPDFTWAAMQQQRPAAPAPEPAPPQPEPGTPTVDPAESQQTAAKLMNFDGEPFPGYEDWRPALAGDDEDFTVEIDRRS